MTGLVLSGMVISENAALPAFTVAVLAIALAVERPTAWRQVLVLVSLLVAYEIRAQALVLLAILPAALVLDLVIAARGGVPRTELLARLRRFAPLGAVLVIGFLAYLARSGFSPGRAVGAYHRVATTHYDPLDVLLWTARHAGEAALALAVAPVCALLLLLFVALSRGIQEPAERAFVATASAAAFLFLLQAGMYAAAFNPGIHERYSMYAFPPLLIALVVWLGRGLPRPAGATLAAALSSVALAGFVIFGGLLRAETPSPVFARLSLYFFTRISEHVPGGLDVTRLLLLLFSLAAAAAFALAPAGLRECSFPAPRASYYCWLHIPPRASSPRTAAAGRTRPARCGAGSMTASEAPQGGRATSTSRIRRRSRARPCSSTPSSGIARSAPCTRWTPQSCARSRSGCCTSMIERATCAVASRRQTLGTSSPTAGSRLRGKSWRRRTDRSAADHLPPNAAVAACLARRRRLRRRRTGPDASYSQYWLPQSRPGTVEVTLSRVAWTGPDVPGMVTVTVGRLGARSGTPPTGRGRWLAHRGESTVLRLRTPRPPFRVSVHVAPTFSPAQLGSRRQPPARSSVSGLRSRKPARRLHTGSLPTPGGGRYVLLDLRLRAPHSC